MSWELSIELPFCYFAMTTFDDQVLVAGGKDSFGAVTSKIVSIKDKSMDEFTKMPREKWAATAFGCKKTLIIAGGRNETTVLASTEVFDSRTGQWYITNCLPSPRHSLWSGRVGSHLEVLTKMGNFLKWYILPH